MLRLREFRFLPKLCRNFHAEVSKRSKKVPESWDLMTGMELFQSIQYAKGNKDPFFIFPLKRGPGTKECPNIIPSVFDKRVIACQCSEDSVRLVYWWLHECYPRRCNCNYWFVLERREMPKIYDN